MLRPHPAWAEQDAEDWWASACAALRARLSRIDVRQVEALAVTHQRESFVPVDGEERPLRHAILWLDERSRAQLKWLDRTFGSDALHELTGKPPP
ncbi:MAG: FGGY family carbohydrate kinase [Chloroflexota bacterium]|nr:FGGY family carbohydrate kinase [Chloroflexota bacterium]